MPEDTLVNTEVTWPEPETAGLVVREMQTKLHRWAGDDPVRRFSDLYDLVCAPAFLVTAYERVRRNKGARTAGIDRATVAQIESQIGTEAFLGQIRAELKARTFRPVPVREVMIPKASGKMRSLGIPTVADRVVQAALKLVLEPIFEADFQPCSYGFRPRRRAQDVIAEIHHFTTRGYEWVLEADIQACFDEIDHVALMGRVRVRIGDKKVLALVKAFLKAGVMTTTGDREGTLTGTPQGGILSPLLANIALSVLDDHFVSQWQEQMGTGNQRARRRRHGLGTWRHCRYADDFVIVVNGDRVHAEALRQEVAEVIAPMGLRLSPEKTRVVGIDEGFDFLGFHIRRMRKRGTSKSYVYTVPSRRAIQVMRDKVKALTSRSTLNQDLAGLLARLARSLKGWANYFRHAVAKKVFNQLDYHAWRRVGAWLRHKHGGLSWRQVRHRFCDIGWRYAEDGVVFTGASSVMITGYRYRGNQIATPWTAQPATA